MNDETKTYTVEEVRTAFMDGAAWVDDFRARYAATPDRNERVCETLHRYPKPKKLREVTANGFSYRVVDDSLQCDFGHGWQPSSFTREEVRVVKDLFDHPYEDDNS